MRLYWDARPPNQLARVRRCSALARARTFRLAKSVGVWTLRAWGSDLLGERPAGRSVGTAAHPPPRGWWAYEPCREPADLRARQRSMREDMNVGKTRGANHGGSRAVWRSALCPRNAYPCDRRP